MASSKKGPAQGGKKRDSGADSVQIRDTLAAIFAWRLFNAICVRTFFQPDEYFQALEPAWQLVYGKDSGAWLTWEWVYGLRSSLHPAIFALGYLIVENVVGSHSKLKAQWLLAAPKVMQAGFAALGDWYTWRLAEKLYGRNTIVARSVLVMTFLNPWQWYTSTRTFSNCFEATLTSAALFYFPWELLGIQDDGTPVFTTSSKVNNLRLSLISAALAVLLRPTNALIWLAISTLVLTRLTLDGKSPLTRDTLLVLFREAIICGLFALGLSLLADRQYFGDWTFPPFTWMRFNVVHDLAVFYGENDWHYYLSQGIPLLCTTIAPFALTGLFKSSEVPGVLKDQVTSANAMKALTFIVLTTISSLSFVSHKEVRFITPLLPILHILAAPHVTSFFITSLVDVSGSSNSSAPRPLGWKRKPALLAVLFVNIVIGGYLASFHAAAPISVMSFLRAEFERVHPDHLDISRPAAAAAETIPNELFALFLTPCHATPWRSHLVYPALRARGLTCDPPVETAPGSAERRDYQHEDARFFADPASFLRDELWPRAAPGEDVPRYIVGFEGAVGDALEAYFGDRRPGNPGARHNVVLKEVWSAWNGLFSDDDRKAGRLVVWSTGFYDDPIDYVGML